jgi:hypothetical protein
MIFGMKGLLSILLVSEICFCHGFRFLSTSNTNAKIKSDFKSRRCCGQKAIVSMCNQNYEADAENDQGRRIFVASSLATMATIGSLYLALPQILGPATRTQVLLSGSIDLGTI